MYYHLPQINHFLNEKDFFIKLNNENDTYINYSLHQYLNKAKLSIEQYGNLWDMMKKYTNPYEFIHTSYDLNKYVSKLKPISRAYYKMIEIVDDLKLLKNLNNSINSFHLAEGPGGFIEALANIRDNKKDKYIGMTLIDNTKSQIPGWKRTDTLLKKFNNIEIESGITNDGDLYKYENLIYLKEKYGHTMDLVTADGGFDFSIDFNKQEQLSSKLIFAQIVYALTLQKKHGTFILKVFDCFLKSTVNMIYLLSCMYNEVIIIKPNTSRYGNSERYIVCKDFKYESINFIRKKLYNSYELIMNDNKNIESIFSFEVNQYFLTKLIEINAILGQQQLETIMKTFVLIEKGLKKNEKFEIMKKKSVENCIDWCNKHNIPTYVYKKINIFK